MNYLFFTEYFPSSETSKITGGVESRYFYIVKELSKNNSVTVICSRQPGEPKESKVFGAKVIKVGPHIPYSNKGNIFKRFLFAYSSYLVGKRLKEVNIVEAGSFLTYLPAYFVGKKIKAKKVATWHETWVGNWIKNKGWITGLAGEVWERLALNLKWDKIISVSNFTRERLLKHRPKCKNIIIIPNGVELDPIKRITTTKYKDPTLVCFGRLSPTKNNDVVIRALKLIQKEIPKVKLNILGEGPERNKLERLTKELELEKEVKFFGSFKEHEDILREAKRAHLFISASTLEGFGMTVIEAMALELPVVITSIPPFREIGEDKVLFFKEYKELSFKVISLLKDKKSYSEQIKKQNILIHKYDWKIIVHSLSEKI